MPRYGAYDKNDNHTYAIGVFPSMELLAARPESVRCLLVSPAGYQNAGVNKLIEACRGMNVPVEEAPRAVERISGKENSWVVTVLNKYACSLDPAANHVVLHNPSDVGNAGTILRSALGFGFKNVAIIRPGVDPFDPRVIRASMGAAFRAVPVSMTREAAVASCRANGVRLLATALRADAHDLREETLSQTAVIIGSEGQGVCRELLDAADGTVIIPMQSHCESLNAAVAATIVMWQMRR